MGNSGSSGGGSSRKARSLPNSPEAHRYLSILSVELIRKAMKEKQECKIEVRPEMIENKMYLATPHPPRFNDDLVNRYVICRGWNSHIYSPLPTIFLFIYSYLIVS